jgi:predicted O-methyltransferase YrrM
MTPRLQTAADVTALDAYGPELAETGVLALIDGAERAFRHTVIGRTARGNVYGFGGMRPEACVRLYALVRETSPAVCVETGVCNGVSTTVILAALERNGHGRLCSIDHPEHAGAACAADAFWPGKGGAVVPSGQEPGWLVPERLRPRWTLTLGRSQDALPPLLAQLGAIDFFLHDGEHSPACMRFEYDAAWPRLREGGVLASDDVTWNTEFDEFARRAGRQPIPLAHNIAFLIR